MGSEQAVCWVTLLAVSMKKMTRGTWTNTEQILEIGIEIKKY